MKKQAFYCLLLAVLLLFGISDKAQAAACASYYITTEGEDIAGIALRCGADAELLAAINNAQPDAPLAAGTLITLPQEPAAAITVQAGDTLYALAQRYRTSVSALMERNQIRDVRLLQPGQTLYLPLDEECAVFAVSGDALQSVPVLASRGTASFLWPVSGVISSRYGARGSGYHYGLDLAADAGSEIVAAAAGIVSEADWKNDAYGYAVMIDHGDGFQTLYAHCQSLLVEEGETVLRGDAIALVGSTGNSTGPHVHFEVRLGGACQDPLLYLR